MGATAATGSSAAAGGTGATRGQTPTKKPIILVAAIALAVILVVSAVVFVIVPLLTNKPVGTPVSIIQDAVGEPENGNPHFSNIARLDGTTYLLASNSSRRMYQIFKVDDNGDAQSEEIYRFTYSENSSYSLSRMFAYEHRLYFVMSHYGSSSENEVDLVSIDPSAENPIEQKVNLLWSDGYTLPSFSGQDYDYDYAEYYDLDQPLSWLYPLQQVDQYLYLREMTQGDSSMTRLPLFRVDLKLGTISAVEGGTSTDLEWNPQAIHDGYVYYQNYREWEPEGGLCRAKLDRLSNEESLVDAPSLSEVPDPDVALYYQYLSVFFIVDNDMYYMRQRYDEKSEQNKTELHRFDLSSHTDELLLGEYAWSANVRGSDLYYFDEGDLRHIDLGSLEDTLLIRNYSSEHEYKSSLFLSGDWIYYYSDSGYFRVKPDETGFPTKGLT
jgi:hypothetical protein